LARKGASQGQAEINQFREGEMALPSFLNPKALMHGIV
jgi:hypothetical protein